LVINVGAAYNTSLKAVNLSLAEPNFHSAIGLHPIHIYDEEFNIENYQDLIHSSKGRVVAMGETGFDYFHLWQLVEKEGVTIKQVKIKQEEVFRAHIKLAQRNNLALIIHGRNGKEDKTAYQDIYTVLKETKARVGVIHCYGGTLEEAKKFVDLGFYLGFTGIVTFDKTGVLKEVLEWIPEDKILIETDSPYLTPVPNRGKRNEPIYVKYIAEKIAEIRDKSTEEIVKITGDNAKILFNIK